MTGGLGGMAHLPQSFLGPCLSDGFDVFAQDGAEEIVEIGVMPADLRDGEAQCHAEFGHGDAFPPVAGHGEAVGLGCVAFCGFGGT